MEALKIEWSAVLPIGEEKAISGEELARRCGFSDTRALRHAVQDARMNGEPIMSRQGGGYFLPDVNKLEEVKHTLAELKKRAYTTLLQCKQLNKWLSDQEGGEPVFEQLTLSDFMRECEG